MIFKNKGCWQAKKWKGILLQGKKNQNQEPLFYYIWQFMLHKLNRLVATTLLSMYSPSPSIIINYVMSYHVMCIRYMWQNMSNFKHSVWLIRFDIRRWCMHEEWIKRWKAFCIVGNVMCAICLCANWCPIWSPYDDSTTYQGDGDGDGKVL